jgi:hypothetical protein
MEKSLTIIILLAIAVLILISLLHFILVLLHRSWRPSGGLYTLYSAEIVSKLGMRFVPPPSPPILADKINYVCYS